MLKIVGIPFVVELPIPTMLFKAVNIKSIPAYHHRLLLINTT